jgi:hypothetical protein
MHKQLAASARVWRVTPTSAAPRHPREVSVAVAAAAGAFTARASAA